MYIKAFFVMMSLLSVLVPCLIPAMSVKWNLCHLVETPQYKFSPLDFQLYLQGWWTLFMNWILFLLAVFTLYEFISLHNQHSFAGNK